MRIGRRKRRRQVAALFFFPSTGNKKCTQQGFARERLPADRGADGPLLTSCSHHCDLSIRKIFCSQRRDVVRSAGGGTPSTVSTSTRFGKYLSWPVRMGRSYATTRRFDPWRKCTKKSDPAG